MCPQITSASGAASVEAFWRGSLGENDYGTMPATVAWTTLPAVEQWHITVPSNSTIQSMDVLVRSPSGQTEAQLPSIPYNLGPGDYDGSITLPPQFANGAHILSLRLHGQFSEVVPGCCTQWYSFTDAPDYWLRVDAQAPAPPSSSTVVQGDGWHSTPNLDVQVALPSQDPATQTPITALWYRLCRASNRSDCTTKQSVPVTDPTAPSVYFTAKAPDPGDRLVDVFLQDGAGNVDETLYNDDAHVRYDPDPPRVNGFTADDPSDPTRIVAQAYDSTSGIADGEIDYEVIGGPATWHALPTTTTQSGLEARLDDSQVPAGQLRFRAIATDLAGNSAAATHLSGSGQDFVLRTPLRESTRLGISVRRALRATRRRCGRSHGRRRCTTVFVPPARRQPRDLHLAFGRRKRLHGLITTAQGRPIAGGAVQVVMASNVAGSSPTALTVHANRAGQFSFVIPAGPSRSVDVAYLGSAHLQPARRHLAAATRGKVNLSARPRSIRAPGTIDLAGSVDGRPLPPGGKLVSLQTWRAGRWETFATVHTDANGQFRYAEAIRNSPAGTYRLRAVIPREAGYPYAAGHSREVWIRVR